MGAPEGAFDELRRRARILVLLDSAQRAGLAPIDIVSFHAFAYLANVLAPVWDMPALDGSVLKRKGGPFYPSLQRDMDRMVGVGMILIADISHVRDHRGRWRLTGKYDLNYDLSRNALEFWLSFDDEMHIATFVRELAYALCALSDSELGTALTEDATYGDPSVSDDNVVDFAEWALRNPSATAAGYFDHFMPAGTKATPGERLHLYIRHLQKRLHSRGGHGA